MTRCATWPRRSPPGNLSTGHPPRSLATAYLVWFLVGIFGGHRFHLGDRAGGRWYLAALAVGLALPALGLGLALLTQDVTGVAIGSIGWIAGLVVLLGVLAMAIVDAFRLPALTRRANAAGSAVEAAAGGVAPGAETPPGVSAG